MQYVGIISVVLALLLVVEVQARRKWDKPELEISHFYPGGHYIMLTFDNLDAGEEVTLELLKVLEQRKARATFFVEGHEAENHPDLLKSMVKQRHEIANLGWQSSNSSSSDKDGDTTNSGIPHDEEILENIQKTATIVEKITGKSTTVFRPTAMANLYNQKQAELISGHGHAHPHQVVLFSLDARKAKSEKELTSVSLRCYYCTLVVS